MKKISLIFIILLIPLLVQAQSMIETKEINVNQDTKDNLLVNEASINDEEEAKEKTTVSVEIDIPDIRILPSSPFYFLKKTWENVRGWFIFNTKERVEYGIDLANRRLEEIESLALKKKTDLINKTTEEFNKRMEEVNKNIDQAKNKGTDLDNIYSILEANREKHGAVFDQLINQVPEETKETIKKAKEVSQKGYEVAQERIKPKAIEGGLKGIEKVKEGLDVLEEKLQEEAGE